MEETQSILELLAKRLKIKLEEVSPLLHQLQKQVRGRSANNVIGSEKAESIQGVFDSLCLMELDSFISNRLPLLNLRVEILEALKSGKIEYTKAKAIACIRDKVIFVGDSAQLPPVKEDSPIVATSETVHKATQCFALLVVEDDDLRISAVF